MKPSQYRKMQKTLHSPIIIRFDINPLPSSTDPTQDIPVSCIQFGLNDIPLNVKINKGLAYSNRPIEQMSSIDRRNFDAFDAVGELRSIEKNNKGKKVLIPQNKKQNEN